MTPKEEPRSSEAPLSATAMRLHITPPNTDAVAATATAATAAAATAAAATAAAAAQVPTGKQEEPSAATTPAPKVEAATTTTAAAAAAAKGEKTEEPATQEKKEAAAAAKTEEDRKPVETPQDAGGPCVSGSDCCNSSSSCPYDSKAAAAAAAAAASGTDTGATAKGDTGNDKGSSINYAEQYIKTMGLSSSSCSKGFDLAAAAAARDLPSDACEEGETTGFKFPSYEEFLKEETEDTAATKETPATDDQQRLDGAFAAFLTELERIPTTNAKSRRAAAAASLEGKSVSEMQREETAKVVVAAFGDAESECVRLTSQAFSSPFQVLLLTPDATEADIRRQYRKLSLLIHPDKCQHELAHEAFQIVNKAYEKVQEEGVRQRYEEVIEEAKKRVLKQRIQENKARRAAGKELLPETMDALRGLVFEACEVLLKEIKEKKDYAEKCKKANEKYERDKEDKLIEEEKEKCRERNEWVKKREERVTSWRDYQDGLKAKQFEHRAFTRLRHVREERKDDDLLKKRQKVQGIDNSYKLNWR